MITDVTNTEGCTLTDVQSAKSYVGNQVVIYLRGDKQKIMGEIKILGPQRTGSEMRPRSAYRKYQFGIDELGWQRYGVC